MNVTTDQASDLVSIDALYEAAYHRGVCDALDQLAEIACDPRQLRGTVAVKEARRLLGADRVGRCVRR